MKLNRFLSYFLGFFSLTLPAFVYELHIKWLGFPDGYRTELEQAEKNLYQIFIWPGFALGMFFIYLGWTASKGRINKRLVISISMFILYVIITIIVDYYLRLHLDKGTGG